MATLCRRPIPPTTHRARASSAAFVFNCFALFVLGCGESTTTPADALDLADTSTETDAPEDTGDTCGDKPHYGCPCSLSQLPDPAYPNCCLREDFGLEGWLCGGMYWSYYSQPCESRFPDSECPYCPLCPEEWERR